METDFRLIRAARLVLRGNWSVKRAAARHRVCAERLAAHLQKVHGWHYSCRRKTRVTDANLALLGAAAQKHCPGVTWTLAEIADAAGITRERVRQIEAKALKGLWNALYRRRELEVMRECFDEVSHNRAQRDGWAATAAPERRENPGRAMGRRVG